MLFIYAGVVLRLQPSQTDTHLGHVIVLCEVSELEYTCKYSNPLDKRQDL